MNQKEIEMKKQYLFNEIVNVAPAAFSPHYMKSKKANERLTSLKQEFDEFINALSTRELK